MNWECVNCGQYNSLGDCCENCASQECDRCHKPIELDEDIGVEQVYGEIDNFGAHLHEFYDGAWRVHLECLTPAEKILYDKIEEDES